MLNQSDDHRIHCFPGQDFQLQLICLRQERLDGEDGPDADHDHACVKLETAPYSAQVLSLARNRSSFRLNVDPSSWSGTKAFRALRESVARRGRWFFGD